MGENRREKQGSGGGFKRRSVYFANLILKQSWIWMVKLEDC